MFRSAITVVTCVVLVSAVGARAQDSSAPAASTPAAPVEHVLGTVASIDPGAHTVTVKEDKTGTEHLILLENTRTLLKVEPGAKDLKTAVRITADDLAVGDRVDVRGSKPADNASAMAARSVVLMSGRDLAQAHQAEAAAWQHSSIGTVESIDPASRTLTVNLRTLSGPQVTKVETSPATAFTRYAPADPKVPAPSKLEDIQPGDQVRIIGDLKPDSSALVARKVYSGAFRTVALLVTAVAPDGKQLTGKDLQTKDTIQVALTDETNVRKLPPMMAAALARRFNPAATQQPAGDGAAPKTDAARTDAPRTGEARSGEGRTGQGGPPRAGNGDLSRMLERIPKVPVTDIHSGDAVVVSGVAEGAGSSRVLASNIIAGVEPIFQSAPPRRGQSLGEWSLDMQAPAQ